MTQSSQKAYIEGKEKRRSHKRTILDFLMNNPEQSFTFPEVSKYTGISINNCHKRLSDLEKEGLCKIVGKTKTHSLYCFGITQGKLTKIEAYDKAINEICPYYLEQIKTRAKELIYI